MYVILPMDKRNDVTVPWVYPGKGIFSSDVLIKPHEEQMQVTQQVFSDVSNAPNKLGSPRHYIAIYKRDMVK